MDLTKIPSYAGRGLVHMVVDTPQGSRNKYKFDAALGMFKLSRVLPVGMHFPYDFGSIPGTVGEDGDALDVVAITDTPSFIGCLMAVRLIGVIAAKQTDKQKTIRNDRLLAVPVTPVNKPAIRYMRDLPEARIRELEQFFVNYNKAHGRRFEPIARLGPLSAERLIRAAARLNARPRKETRRS
jgi:inorganic pyrophosphatase